MNFTTVGEGIERLIYRLEDIPARFNVQALRNDGGQSSTDALHFMKCLRSTPTGLAREGWSTYIFNMTEEGEQPNVTQFEVSRNDHEAGNDGILNNGAYWTIVAYTPAKFWGRRRAALAFQ